MNPNNYLLLKNTHINNCLIKNKWINIHQNQFINLLSSKYLTNILTDVFVYRNKYITIITNKTDEKSLYQLYNSRVYISSRITDINDSNLVFIDTHSYNKFKLHFESIYEIFLNIDNFCI
jgi:hypothetical protein